MNRELDNAERLVMDRQTAERLPDHRALGKRLRHHRRRAGLTQVQLAVRAGFSERVIRKAEAGDVVRPETLEVLAEALSSDAEAVTAADLRGDPMALVHRWWELRKRHSYDFPRHIGGLLHDDFRFISNFEADSLPYAGSWNGVEGLVQYYEAVRHYFKPLGTVSTRFLSADNHVTAMVHGRAQPLRDVRGEPLPPDTPPLETWYLYEWRTESGLIFEHSLYGDSLAWKRALHADDPVAEEP